MHHSTYRCVIGIDTGHAVYRCPECINTCVRMHIRTLPHGVTYVLATASLIDTYTYVVGAHLSHIHDAHVQTMGRQAWYTVCVVVTAAGKGV